MKYGYSVIYLIFIFQIYYIENMNSFLLCETFVVYMEILFLAAGDLCFYIEFHHMKPGF